MMDEKIKEHIKEFGQLGSEANRLFHDYSNLVEVEMAGTDKLRWVEPLSKQTLLRATIDSRASDDVKQTLFKNQYNSIWAMFGTEVADTLKWDKGHGPKIKVQ